MDLYVYLKQYGRREFARLAMAAGTSPGYLEQVAYGYKSPSRKLALRIEDASERVVKLEEIMRGNPKIAARRRLCAEGRAHELTPRIE